MTELNNGADSGSDGRRGLQLVPVGVCVHSDSAALEATEFADSGERKKKRVSFSF